MVEHNLHGLFLKIKDTHNLKSKPALPIYKNKKYTQIVTIVSQYKIKTQPALPSCRSKSFSGGTLSNNRCSCVGLGTFDVFLLLLLLSLSRDFLIQFVIVSYLHYLYLLSTCFRSSHKPFSCIVAKSSRKKQT